MDIKEIRAKYPQYGDLSDEQLGQALHAKFYSDMPYEQFALKAGITKQQQIGEAGFPQAMKEELASRSIPAKMAAGAGTALDLAALRLKQAVSGLTPEDQARVQANRMIASDPSGMAGSVAGNVAMLSSPMGRVQAALTPAVGAIPAAAAVGAGSTLAMTPTIGNESELTNAALGAAGGAAGQVVGAGMSRLAQPVQNASESAKRMIAEKVRLSPGQAAGGLVNRVEQQLESIPIIGWFASGARGRAVKDMNLAALAKTVPEGQQVAFTKAGREAIDQAHEVIDKAYDAAYSRIAKPVSVDSTFKDAIKKIPNQEGIDLPDSLVKRFDQLVKDRVLGRMKEPATAETLRDVNNSLGSLSRKYRSSLDPDQKALGDALAKAKEQFRSMVAREAGPEVKSALDGLDNKYSMLVAVEKAAGYSGSKDGIFSAEALKRAASKSTADTRQFAQAASDVLGRTVPDSGTAGRMLVPLAFGGAAAGNESVGGPAWLTGALAAPLMFSSPMGRYMSGTLPGQAMLGQSIREMIPVGVQAGRTLATQ